MPVPVEFIEALFRYGVWDDEGVLLNPNISNPPKIVVEAAQLNYGLEINGQSTGARYSLVSPDHKLAQRVEHGPWPESDITGMLVSFKEPFADRFTQVRGCHWFLPVE